MDGSRPASRSGTWTHTVAVMIYVPKWTWRHLLTSSPTDSAKINDVVACSATLVDIVKKRLKIRESYCTWHSLHVLCNLPSAMSAPTAICNSSYLWKMYILICKLYLHVLWTKNNNLANLILLNNYFKYLSDHYHLKWEHWYRIYEEE